MGFKAKEAKDKDTKYCWCPCSNNIQEWKTEFQLNDCFGKNEDSTKYCHRNEARSKDREAFTPRELISHLDIRKNKCPIYFGIRCFLSLKHGFNNFQFGHKVLYELGSYEYKVAKQDEKEKGKL